MDQPKALILTNSKDATVDYLCEKFRESDVPFHRFNTDCDVNQSELLFKDGEICLNHAGVQLRPNFISSLWFRRPKPIQLENSLNDVSNGHACLEWSEAIEGLLAHIPISRWINHPSCNSIASHKIEQLNRAKQCGMMIPDSLVTNDPSEASQFIADLNQAVIVKPLASGYIECDDGDVTVYTQQFREEHIPILDEIRNCPVLLQHKVDKVADVRVTVLDEFMTAVSLTAADFGGEQRLDIRRDNMSDVLYQIVSIPRHIEVAIRKLLTRYHLRFAAIDFAINQGGEWVFFEVNPNGQWAWLDLCADAKISDIFVEVFQRDQASM